MTTTKPRIMILCGASPRHLYVANRLCAVSDPLAIVMETGRRVTLRKIIHQGLNGALWRKAWRKIRDRPRYAGNKEAAFFFGHRAPGLDRPELKVDVPHINDSEVYDLVCQHNPDIIAVFGTSLLRGPLLEREGQIIANLHGGLSPWYRGADCTFWALHNGEPDKVGCTLHFIDKGIDTGRLIAHVSPEVKAGDDELILFWRAVSDSAEVYAQALEKLSSGVLSGEPQSGEGALYQVKDRLWRHERKLAQLMEEGLLTRSPLPSRVKWFGGD